MVCMLKSTDLLQRKVSEPLAKTFGPRSKVLTVEAHGNEIRGFALCPGKIVKYVLDAQCRRLSTADHLVIAKTEKPDN